MTIRIMVGDCIERLQELEADSLDSACTDPPYHLTSTVKRFGGEGAAPAQSKGTGVYARASRGFMGQKWDGGDVAFRPETWRAVYRVLKPGAYLAAFAAPRNSHRMACAIEDAGFEIRDEIATLICSDHVTKAFLASLDPEQQQAFARCIHDSPFGGVLEWVFGSGFPKSNDAERDIAKLTCPLEGRHYARAMPPEGERRSGDHVCPVTPQSAPWRGYGSALKPAREPIVIARKPLIGSIAANILRHGTGALNIDVARIDVPDGKPLIEHQETGSARGYDGGLKGGKVVGRSFEGRYPANLIHDGSPEVLNGFPETKSGALASHHRKSGKGLNGSGTFAMRERTGESSEWTSNEGSASRFFYTAKPDSVERHSGCGDMPGGKSSHPTVKPIDLLQYVIGLVTPKGGTVLDPFLGSGTTAIAAAKLQMNCVGMELSPDYVALAERRIHHHVGLFADLTIELAPPAPGVENLNAGATDEGRDGESSDCGTG